MINEVAKDVNDFGVISDWHGSRAVCNLSGERKYLDGGDRALLWLWLVMMSRGFAYMIALFDY